MATLIPLGNSVRATIYYHDPIEVDPLISWTGLCRPLDGAARVDIATVQDPRITSLFAYARPDVVIAMNGIPVVSIEQTAMNPSGHNIPQRFSFQVRAAELGVPSILYYPEKARRTFSDPNVRYLNVRVPLAQLRLSELFKVPAMSCFWPTNDDQLPDTRQSAHRTIASLVAALVQNFHRPEVLLALPEVREANSEMRRVIDTYSTRYRQNRSVRQRFPEGFDAARTDRGESIDPPNGCYLHDTTAFLEELAEEDGILPDVELTKQLLARKHTLVFTGTANSAGNDSEHPWPGYLSLLDILYCRKGAKQQQRAINLVYRLPVPVSIYLARAQRRQVPTATYIVDSFADLVWLDEGMVPGRSMRGERIAERV